MLHPFNLFRPCDYFCRDGRGIGGHKIPALDENDPEPENGQTPLLDISRQPNNSTTSSATAALSSLTLLEAALFLAKEPLSARRLAQIANLPERTKTKNLIGQLNERYNQCQSAFCVVEVAEGYQLRTRPEFAPYLVRLQEVPNTIRLSQPALETLTVIAYKQPVQRADVEKVRGVQCGELIRQLLDSELVRITGRCGELGRPFLYGTTKKFLQTFGLNSIEDLP